LDVAYVPLAVPPEALDDAMTGLRALGVLGANVTIPHKQAVVPHLDALSPQAAAVGAVNTIVREEAADGTVRLRGDNTDVAGFLAPLDSFAEALTGAEMLIFGAGGAARAVAYALLTTLAPARLTLSARRPAQAERLAADLSAYDPEGALQAIALDDAAAAVRSSRLLVNATPLGMHPHTDGTPWPSAEDFSDEQIAYDLVYNPETTRFLHDAAARGATTIGGLAMLIAQAAASYRQWTDRAMPLDVVRAALEQAG
ncbi:MAG: shikimate dehydrogenase, partial [Bacteroidetes bacterium]|nr:shikimate dehydrogenase [Bacteroidota bacterium]